MINIKRLSKSVLILLPFLTISLFPKEVNAKNLTRDQFDRWCTLLGGMVEQSNQSPAGTIAFNCIVNGNIIQPRGVFTPDPNNPEVFIDPRLCLCDKNGNGVVDAGEQIKEPHRNLWQRIFGWFALDSTTVIAPIAPPILASLNLASENLYEGLEFDNWISPNLNPSGRIEVVVDLREIPTLDQDPTFANEGFTEMNFVYRDEMGSLSGITLASLTQGEENFLELDPNLFDSFGGFSAWQLGVTLYNPTTEQQALLFEDKPVPEPSAMIGLLAVGGLGMASKLKKKSQ